MKSLLVKLSVVTKILLIAIPVLIIYGLVARALHINFFLEAYQFGFLAIVVVLVTGSWDIMAYNETQGKKTTGEWVVFLLCLMLFVTMTIVLIVINTSDCVKEAKKEIVLNEKIKDEFGEIKGFGIIISGSLSTQKRNGITYGDANLSLVVKGKLKHDDISIVMKSDSSGWKLVDFK